MGVAAQRAAKQKDDGRALIESVRMYDSCILAIIFSYKYQSARPPISIEELRRRCQVETEAFKCIRDKTKGGPSMIRRGLLSIVQTRQRHHKKVCTNLESAQSKRFVDGMRCTVEKRFKQFHESDERLVNTLEAIVHRNYNDSAAELKQFCCALHNQNKVSDWPDFSFFARFFSFFAR